MINIIIVSKEEIKPEEIRTKEHYTLGAFEGSATFTKVSNVITKGLFSHWGDKITNLTEEENKITNALLRQNKYYSERRKLHYVLVEQTFKLKQW